MKANNSLLINMPRALELISFFFLGHGPTYPISDLSGSAITKGNCITKYYYQVRENLTGIRIVGNTGKVFHTVRFQNFYKTLSIRSFFGHFLSIELLMQN